MISSSEPANKPAKQPSANISRACEAEQEAADPSVDLHPAATFKIPKNPRATFQALPAELRLQIYELLCESVMIHVYRHKPDGKPMPNEHDDADETVKFSWTPCRATSPQSPLFCAEPAWTGTCVQQDDHKHKLNTPPAPLGFWALAACNKALFRETSASLLRNTVVSIYPADLAPWLTHLSQQTPSRTSQVQRLTLAGPEYRANNATAMQTLRSHLPNLHAVAVQGRTRFWDWARYRSRSSWQMQTTNGNSNWLRLESARLFPPSLSVAFEANVWRNKGTLFPVDPHATQRVAAIRFFGRGTDGVHDEAEDQWKMEIQTF